jgi:predicted N-acyltransferase
MALRIDFHDSMAAFRPDEWNRLHGGADPGILSWGYLRLLEASGSITPATGWQPAHFAARRDGVLVAAAPLYIKSHSWGEYVYDFPWADAAEQLGLAYYPKLVGCVPATPAESWRLLVADGEDPDDLGARFLEATAEFCRSGKIGSRHFLFVDPRWSRRLAGGGCLAWEHQSFRWENAGHADFAGFTAAMGKNMRRNIRRERESVRSQGFRLEMLPGHLADDRTRELMAEYYLRTNARFGPWAARFLSPEFFARLNEFIPDGHSFSLARLPPGEAARQGLAEGEAFALSFLLQDTGRLLGRFWGAAGERRDLHFELCYYQPIAWALERGIPAYDPGPGSEHKVRRGFRAVATRSWHCFADRRLQALFGRYIPKFNRQNAELIDGLNRQYPFRGDGRDAPEA